MIIEQVEALKTWLTAKLSPICDAEPGALAKYVCALVKKDKPEQDLRDICVDQLDVFLQQNTKPFVNDLFDVLKSKAYIPPACEAKPKPAAAASVTVKGLSAKDKDETQKKKSSEISSTTDDKENKNNPATLGSSSSVISPSLKSVTGTTDPVYSKDNKEPVTSINREPPRECRETTGSSKDCRDRDRGASRDRRDSWRDERSRDGIRDARDIIRENRERDKDRGGGADMRDSRGDTREVREPRDRIDFRDRDRDMRRRRTRSRSFSPRRRDFDDRPARRRFEERSRYSPDRRWGRRRSWSRSPRRNRSPIDSRGGGRLRSRSPRLRASRSPRGRSSRSPVRYRPLRSRTRSRSPRPRSWSRPGSGGVGRPKSRSLSLTRQPDSRGSTPLQDNDFISSSTNDAPAVSSTVSGLRPMESKLGETNRIPGGIDSGSGVVGLVGTRARCQNFEEKGFCMLGDVCPYDHGADPVVVEDDTLALDRRGPALEGSDFRLPPPGHLDVQLNLNRPPSAHVEPYFPENPSLQVPLRPFLRGPPPDLRHPPPGMLMNRPVGPDIFPLPKREVIVSRPPPGLSDRDLLESGGPLRPEPSRIVIPAKRPFSAIDRDLTTMNIGQPSLRMAHINQHHQMFGPVVNLPSQQQLPPDQIQPQPMSFGPQAQPGPVRKGFDYSRLGGRGFKHQSPNKVMKFGNMTLEVRKIPAEMNNIAKLNEHFGKFGTLTNIQVKFQGDPGAALISFSTNAQAVAAYRSPEPVFNNRFIKLFWHNAEKPLSLDGERETPIGASEDNQAPSGQQHHTQRTLTGGRIGDGINHPSLVLPVRSSIPPAHKMSLDNTKGKQKDSAHGGEDVTVAASTETKSIVYTSSMGNLKKTVFNPTVAAPIIAKPKPAPFVSPTAVKTADYVSRMEAIKRIEEERKLAPAKQAEIEQKKQELLAKQIEQQKKLLETLEKKKDTMGVAEKQMLRMALRKISDAIDTVKYGTGTKKASVPISPQQFKYVSSQEQAASAQPMPTYGRGSQSWSSGGRGGYGWTPRGPSRGWAAVAAFGGRTTLDNRPKTVEVKGFDVSELDEIRVHFQKFGEVEKEDLVEEIPSAFFTFVMRQSAELAVAQGSKFKKKMLIVRWNQVTPKISRAESTQSSDVDEDLSITLRSIDSESTLLDGVGKSVPSSPAELLDSPQLNACDESQAANSEQLDITGNMQSTTNYERSLSEDLLAGEEENFKASYTDDDDDDDDEDHITVTLSNTSTSTPTIYTSSRDYGTSSKIEMGETNNLQVTEADDDDDDLNNLDPGPALDFIEEEAQV